MTSLSLKEYADETDIRLREANKLRIDAKT